MTTTVPLLRVRGACPHDCPDTCATITEVENGRAVRFYADPQHPITDGWLCAKVRPYLERVYHPDRLTHPLRRVGPKGSEQWQRISWDEAISEITSRWQAIIAEYGAAAILPYSYSGTLGVLQAGVADQRLWNRMGASGLDRAICCAASHAAVYATIGARHSADYSDLPDSRLIVIWGHNPATAGPHAMPFIRQAQRNGTRVIVIDPRRSATARSADQHLQLRPATDAALALGVMHVIFRDNLHGSTPIPSAGNSCANAPLTTRLSASPPSPASAPRRSPRSPVNTPRPHRQSSKRLTVSSAIRTAARPSAALSACPR